LAPSYAASALEPRPGPPTCKRLAEFPVVEAEGGLALTVFSGTWRGTHRAVPAPLSGFACGRGGGGLGSSTRTPPAGYPPLECALLDPIALRRCPCKTECQQEQTKEKGHCNSDRGPEDATHARSYW
jgi:hypothetical protein